MGAFSVDCWLRFTPHSRDKQQQWINSNSLLSNAKILKAGVNKPTNQHPIAFDSLSVSLLFCHQKELAACKN